MPPFIVRSRDKHEAAEPRPLPEGMTAADLRAIEREVARHGFNRPYALGPLVGTCPGTAEYGHGWSHVAVHGGTCCEQWDELVTEAVAAAAAAVPQTYRFRGVTRHGDANFGVTTMAPGELAAWVEDRFRAGFRSLVVVAGAGPTPPRADEGSVAEIGPHPDTGRRTWWAETAGEG